MYSYSNSFRLISKRDGTEVLMQLLQTVPVYNGNDPDPASVSTEELISVIMHPDRARELANQILDVVNNNSIPTNHVVEN